MMTDILKPKKVEVEEAPPPPRKPALKHGPEARAAAASALASLLADPFLCSIVTPPQALALASSLEEDIEDENPFDIEKLSPEQEVRVRVVKALDGLLANNPACSTAVHERLGWLPKRIVGLLSAHGGRHAVCGGAAGIIASLSPDEVGIHTKLYTQCIRHTHTVCAQCVHDKQATRIGTLLYITCVASPHLSGPEYWHVRSHQMMQLTSTPCTPSCRPVPRICFSRSQTFWRPSRPCWTKTFPS